MKRTIVMLLAVLVVMASLPLGALAADVQPASEERIDFEDGSYMVITVEPKQTRSGTKTEYKYQTYYDANDVIQWRITLMGIFTYNYSTSTCDHAEVSVTIYDSNWYVASRSAYTSGNKAAGTVVLGQRVLGVNIGESTYRLSLTCAPDGTMS